MGARRERLGRPRRILDTKQIGAQRTQGVGWKRIAAQMEVGVGTIYSVGIPTKSIIVSEVISITRSEVMPIKIGAKRR
jgi:hypothetical protein